MSSAGMLRENLNSWGLLGDGFEVRLELFDIGFEGSRFRQTIASRTLRTTSGTRNVCILDQARKCPEMKRLGVTLSTDTRSLPTASSARGIVESRNLRLVRYVRRRVQATTRSDCCCTRADGRIEWTWPSLLAPIAGGLTSSCVALLRVLPRCLSTRLLNRSADLVP